MPDAFCALARVNFIDFGAEVDRLIGTLRFTHITIDAFVGDHQSHKISLKSGGIMVQLRQHAMQHLKYPCGTPTQRRLALPLRGL